MKGDGCKKVMKRLLDDVVVVEVTKKGKPLGYISKKYGHRVHISGGLSRALRQIIDELGDGAPPLQTVKW